MQSGTLQNGCLVVVALLGATTIAVATTPADDELKAAEALLKKAQAGEKEIQTEWTSREMARSATREIAKSEGIKVDKAKKAKASADRVVAEITAEMKVVQTTLAAETDEAKKKTLQETIVELQDEMSAARQFVSKKEKAREVLAASFATEQGLFEKSQANLDAVGRKKAVGTLITHEANVKLLTLRYKMAKAQADQAAETCAKAQAAVEAESDEARAAAQKASADCAKAAEAAATKCHAAHRVMVEAELIATLDRHGWNAIERDRIAGVAKKKAEQAQSLTQKAAAENDPAKKKSLQEAATKAHTEQAEARQRVTQLDASIGQAVAERAAVVARLQGGLEPLPAEQWDYAKARHLLVRAGFGGTPEEVQHLYEMGLHKAVDYMVDYAFLPAPNAPFDALAPEKPDALAGYAGKTRIPGAGGRVSSRRLTEVAQFDALRQWWIKRMVESPRQLQEKLTLFWHGHFATQQSVVKHAYIMYQQNQLFREHASGNFGALLYGIVHDPAMLHFLDNNKNIKGKPNENLGREILELFAMGVDQGYTEKDIVQAARALTGYTYDHFSGGFRFIHTKHDTGTKTIFGKAGPWTGDDLVTLILEQPATAQFIASKLFKFFACQEPATETVERLGSVLRVNEYELAPMLKNMFLSQEFYNPQALGTQIKCPVQLVIGMLRDTGVKQVTDCRVLEQGMREMGQALFEPPDVKGWRYGREWISSNRILVRYNRVAELVRSLPQTANRQGIDVVTLLDGKGGDTPAGIIDQLAKTCLSKPLAAEKRKTLIDSLQGLPPRAQWAKQRDEINKRLQQALVLMMSTPEYQIG
ncbi:MAG: DUF1800 family protein [Roseibacillus sp.]|jgi:hypothetical protein|nr:DUF1800 family protein [Roseibacillus sp.]|tara:strand:- start:15385 stop:17835 length:2451 start_codon:yes stop_codon:yes gene_type:complete